MKALILSILIAFSGAVFAQDTGATSSEPVKSEKKKKAKKKKKKKKQKTSITLDNALVIAQMDTPEDRYSIEILLTEMFTSGKINA